MPRRWYDSHLASTAEDFALDVSRGDLRPLRPCNVARWRCTHRQQTCDVSLLFFPDSFGLEQDVRFSEAGNET